MYAYLQGMEFGVVRAVDGRHFGIQLARNITLRASIPWFLSLSCILILYAFKSGTNSIVVVSSMLWLRY